MKGCCHGSQRSRAKRCYSPGNSPGPAGTRLRLAPARSAIPNPPARKTEIGDRETGAGEKPAGRRLATEKRHRVDTGREVTGLSQGGGRSGWAVSVLSVSRH